MHNISRFTPLVVMLAITVVPLGAGAQLQELSSKGDGRGRLQYTTRSSVSNFRKAEVYLRSNGDAEIRARDGVNETFHGRWRNRGERRCEITIERIGRDSADGSGDVYHDGRGSFTRITLNGRTSRARIDLTFDRDEFPGEEPGGEFAISSTRDGFGSIQYVSRSSTSNFSRMAVRLRDNGEFNIQSSEGAREEWSGRWQMDGRRRARLSIDRLGDREADGAGTVELDGRGSFDSVSLSGSSRSTRFSVDFRSGAAGGIKSISSTRDGYGTIQYVSRSSTAGFSRLSVRLRDNGDFNIEALQGTREEWRGRWRLDGSRRARLDVERLGSRDASGSGYVDLDGSGSFNHVSMNGSSGTLRFSMSFRTGRNLPGVGDGGGIAEAAHIAVRKQVQRQFGTDAVIHFVSTRTSQVSATERRVYGEGDVSHRTMTRIRVNYEARVDLRDYSTRSVTVSLE